MWRSRKVADEGWTTVSRFNKSRWKIANQDAVKEIEEVATTFFVSNIPEGCSALRIWKLFKEYGCLVDFYLAQKRDRLGLCFGFARFIKVQDVFKLEKVLGEVRIDNRRLRVNVSKFKRKSGFQEKRGQSHEVNRSGIRKARDSGIFSSSLRGVKSYSEAVSLESCLIGEAKDLERLENFFNIFSASDLVDCSIKYLGGLNILLDFGRKSVADAFLNDHAEGWRKWFSWLRFWDESFSQMHRIVWVKISGMPVQFWDAVFFDVMAERFGRVLIPVEGSNQAFNLSFGRLCLLARNDVIINDCVEVKWKNHICSVRVQEDGCDWSPPRPHIIFDSELESDDDSLNDHMEDAGSDDLDVEKVDDSLMDVTHACEHEVDRGSSPVMSVREEGVNTTGIIGICSDREAAATPMKDASCSDDTRFDEDVHAENVQVDPNVVNGLNLESSAIGLDGGLKAPSVDLGCSPKGFDQGDSGADPISKTRSIPDLNNCADPSISFSSDSVSINDLNSLPLRKGVRMNYSSPVASLNSVSMEIENTVALGKDVGFQMEGSRSDLRTIIEGEGALKKSK
ncbi:hypothetical protein L1887_14495 [Cichorium endivia]|nr:hypothetical protein L1887_14495 [Cichorium endivia]